MSDDQLIAPGTLDAWEEVARGDDWHRRLVGSDIRLLIGDLKRARHRLASTQPAPAFPREEVAITEREVGALRYLLNWSDTGKKVATVMKTFTLDGEERHYTKDTLESLWRKLSAALLQGKQP